MREIHGDLWKECQETIQSSSRIYSREIKLWVISPSVQWRKINGSELGGQDSWEGKEDIRGETVRSFLESREHSPDLLSLLRILRCETFRKFISSENPWLQLSQGVKKSSDKSVYISGLLVLERQFPKVNIFRKWVRTKGLRWVPASKEYSKNWPMKKNQSTNEFCTNGLIEMWSSGQKTWLIVLGND